MKNLVSCENANGGDPACWNCKHCWAHKAGRDCIKGSCYDANCKPIEPEAKAKK